jgi:hypothetical protein
VPAAPPAKAERALARERTRAEARRQASAHRRLAGVEEAILELEEELESLTRLLAEPEVYRDGDLVRKVEAERAEVRARIQALYAEWESAAEEVEGA